MSIVHSLREPEALLEDIHRYFGSLLGSPLVVSPKMILESLGLTAQNLLPKDYLGKCLPVEIEAYLEVIEQTMDIYRFLVKEGKNIGHLGHEMAVLFRSSMETEFLLRLLSDAGKQAGYTRIERKTISASSTSLVSSKEIVQALNRALACMDERVAQPIDSDVCNCRISVNGANMRFNWPEEDTFKGVYVQYLVLS